jgi:hypothetical protein
MCGDTEDVVPGGFDDEEDVEPGQGDGIEVEHVARLPRAWARRN